MILRVQMRAAGAADASALFLRILNFYAENTRNIRKIVL